jgi:prolyl-tRNA synthetase
LKKGDPAVDKACENLYGSLQVAGIDALYDDSDERAGAKFATADLIGVPYQVMVGPRGLKSGMVEIKVRASGKRFELSPEAAISYLTR